MAPKNRWKEQQKNFIIRNHKTICHQDVWHIWRFQPWLPRSVSLAVSPSNSSSTASVSLPGKTLPLLQRPRAASVHFCILPEKKRLECHIQRAFLQHVNYKKDLGVSWKYINYRNYNSVIGVWYEQLIILLLNNIINWKVSSAHRGDCQYRWTNTFCCHKMLNRPCFGLYCRFGGSYFW